MFYTPEPILSQDILDVHKLILIDRGQDTEVFRHGHYVVKKFFDLDHEKVEAYQQLTNDAAAFFKGEKISSSDGDLEVVINPILETYESPSTLDVYSLSPLIEGDNIQDLLNKQLLSQREYNQIDAQLYQLSQQIAQKYGCMGIRIIPWNTKIVGDKLFVTDLAQRVSEFGYKQTAA